MQITDFTFRIILIFIPGVISFIIIDKLTMHKEIKLYQMLIYSLILGFTCYILYFLILQIINIFRKVDFIFLFWDALISNKVTLNPKEISFVTLLSIPLGFFISFGINYKIVYKIAHKLKISNKFGDIDVWSYIMNSDDTSWVIIRDIENDLIYEGWIEAFSDGPEERELLLSDVQVYRNSEVGKLYDVPKLYISQKRENINLEFPHY